MSFADLNDPLCVSSAHASAYVYDIYLNARRMTVALTHERPALLTDCLRRVRDLDEWNRQAMGKRYIADDSIDIALAGVRSALRELARLSTAEYVPTPSVDRCPACLGTLRLETSVFAGRESPPTWCETCFSRVDKSLLTLRRAFSGALHPDICF